MDATRRIFIRNAESRAEREKRGLLAVSNPSLLSLRDRGGGKRIFLLL